MSETCGRVVRGEFEPLGDIIRIPGIMSPSLDTSVYRTGIFPDGVFRYFPVHRHCTLWAFLVAVTG